MILRPYQIEGVAAIRASFAAGKRAPLYTLPTGGGKTITFCHIAKRVVAKGNRVLILAHRQELIEQCSDKLKILKLEHGIIKAGYPRSYWHHIQIASVQTLVRILKTAPVPDLIIIDEAHRATANTYRKIFDAYPKAKRLGVTATPIRGDGSNLSEIYDDLIIGTDIKTLIADGYLVQPIVYAPPPVVDLSDVKITGGDYQKNQLNEVMMKDKKITGDAIQHYRKLADGKPALVFCVTIEHAETVARQFTDAGYEFYAISGKTEKNRRAELIKALTNKKIHGLTSCDLVNEGTDIPAVEVKIGLRPTKSLVIYLQQVGRILRTHEGKNRAIILDHVGNCMEHGLPTADREWSLTAEKPSRRSKSSGPVERIIRCPKCFVGQDPSPKCYVCGHIFEVKLRTLDQVDGELKEVDPRENERLVEESKRRRQEVGMAETKEDLEKIAKERKYKSGWIYWQMKVKGIK